MCTVTYFPLKNKIVFTSNRDEKPNRSALEISKENGVFYPKDAAKNGTWFAVSENGNAIILLNGAFENHHRKNEYRKSRGLIVLELINQKNIHKGLQDIDLEDVEPFTLVVYQEEKLAEFRWDGSGKYFKILDAHFPYIWSSTTLYDEKAQEKRREIFREFLKNENISEQDILDFHHLETDDLENGITIKRQNAIQTISTTQLIMDDEIKLLHLNRLSNDSKIEIMIPKNEPEISHS